MSPCVGTKELTVAFLGLGVMGSPMAVNLQRAGHRVRGWNRSAGKAGPLLEAGGVAVDSIAQAVQGADVVCTNLGQTAAVVEVLTGADGVFAHADPGAIVIDFSTIDPETTSYLARQAAEHKLQMLDAPVSGGEPGAQQGSLSIMVGGDADAFGTSRAVLDAVGRTVVHVGPSGAGQTVKAANQLIVAGNLQVLAEAFVFVQAQPCTVDPDAAMDALASGLAGSAVLTQKREHLLTGQHPPGARTALHHKDLGILMDAAQQAGLALPLGSLLAQLMASAVANNEGDFDHSALVRGVRRLSGMPG